MTTLLKMHPKVKDPRAGKGKEPKLILPANAAASSMLKRIENDQYNSQYQKRMPANMLN
jgi:hypothetical protein